MKTVRLAITFFVAMWSLQVLAQKGVKFDPNYKGYYVLKNLFRGEEEALECNSADSKYMNGGAFMSPQTGPPTGQQWKFVAVDRGWYKMQTRLHGSNKCFEGNAVDGIVKQGAAFMDNCQNVPGQLWRLEEVSGLTNVYRLKTQFNGDGNSLEGNRIGGSRGGNAFMNSTQNVTGQMWYLLKVN
jgi:hypothetical protein